ncbi:MAG: DUF2267 domain-containing protein [Chloroflexi bacterium]|nr:DUF2267 domain-containing protein [Chloroflexota bacterium]
MAETIPTQDQAEATSQAVIDFLKTKLPAPVAAQIVAIPLVVFTIAVCAKHTGIPGDGGVRR